MLDLSQAWTIAMKDLRVELRRRDMLTTAVLFGVLVIVVASLAFSGGKSSHAAPGVFWVSNLFAGMSVLSRLWERERANDVFQRLYAASPFAIFLGKALSAFAMLMLVNLCLLPITWLFFNGTLSSLALALAIATLGSLGFVLAGTVFASLVLHDGGRAALLSVAVFPLITPALLASVVAMRASVEGYGWAETWTWLAFVGVFDLLFVAAGALLFEFLLPE